MHVYIFILIYCIFLFQRCLRSSLEGGVSYKFHVKINLCWVWWFSWDALIRRIRVQAGQGSLLEKYLMHKGLGVSQVVEPLPGRCKNARP
jgi:hypothetical protein